MRLLFANLRYYYARHHRRFSHPYLPCLIEFGNNGHRSFYPLEYLEVRFLGRTNNHTMDKKETDNKSSEINNDTSSAIDGW